MSNGALKLLAGGGAKADPVYVDDLFSTFIDYSGGMGPHTAVTGLDMSGEGGMVWTKPRNGNLNHYLYDTERGATKALSPDQTAVEATITYGLTSFTSTGFTFSISHAPDPNSQVWWSWRKAEKFFDVVTYTGNGNADRQINHNLGSVPGMMIIKKYSGSTTRWAVYHRSVGTGKFLSLDDSDSFITQSDFWQTAPTATQFTVETNGNVNNNGDSYVAYLFGHNEAEYGENSDEAIIHCGSYTGNETNGVEVNCGFEPQWILIKNSSGSGHWWIFDTMRGWTVDTSANQYLRANLSNAEATLTNNVIKPTSTGFKVGPTGYSQIHANSTTHIYMAIARPNKPASEFAANKLFSLDGAGSATNPAYESNDHIVDMAIQKRLSYNSEAPLIFSRLTGNKYLRTDEVDSENTGSSIAFDYMDGVVDSFSATSYSAWMFRRARGFFDVVTYTGTGSDLTVNHNLGATPELIIVKNRNRSENWPVYHSGDSSNYSFLNTNTGGQSNNRFASVTASSFVAKGGSNDVNSTFNDGHIAYLFATVNGISKVGSYTGTGSDLTVDCGFSAGARFVIIKRTDSSGHWFVMDTLQGITVGNDTAFQANEPNAADTREFLKPDNSGFIASDFHLTQNGATYIFLAIA